ncbi:hypothetical protein JL09_g6313, partial [Pichia kudriavzevii]
IPTKYLDTRKSIQNNEITVETY